jgi:hypothetical protein
MNSLEEGNNTYKQNFDTETSRKAAIVKTKIGQYQTAFFGKHCEDQ